MAEGGDDFNPFTDEDLQKILQIEAATSKEEGWKFLSKSEDLYEIWRMSEEHEPVHLIRGTLHFKDIPPKAVADIVHDVESRPKWDKVFNVIEVLESHKNYRVVYWLTKMPIGVSDRDLVQNISTRYDKETDTTYIMYQHTTHPSKPEVHGVVRAETILSGVIIRPDPDDPNSTRLSMIIQIDIKGWMPHFVVNAFAAKSPPIWQNSLRDYYWNDYSKQHRDS